MHAVYPDQVPINPVNTRLNDMWQQVVQVKVRGASQGTKDAVQHACKCMGARDFFMVWYISLELF